ncbi:glycoside hydrolase family 72 protein [Hortaea werneckii]|nr:glycoside hydrolase family 72 protein [Hortaea werneckii]KAI7002787.1 glycoside hydrolase family 72 protein [Hortaea werneckii]KAI7661242.1 glycoside hydrolase family 72 protein [Hortaea werneckii]
MQTLGTNSIRVYHVDPDADHDGCMQAFADAGIYAWIDLDTFDTYVYSPQDPRWTEEQYSKFSKVMDAFHNYDNVAGFFVANELLNAGSDSVGAPYVKAAGVDMKTYRDSQGYREIPIGYSAADIAELRPNLQNYMACGDSFSETLDFFSLNAYEWCGDSSYEESGYSQLDKNATGYPIPIFFSETGCNVVEPRTFGDQAAILGEEMSDQWSGAIIYEWIQETNSYGLISYGPPAPTDAPAASNVVNGFTRAGTPTPVSPDFENLSSVWASVTPSSVSKNAFSPSVTQPLSCPEYTENLWIVSADAPLPTVGKGAAQGSSDGSSSAKSTTSGGGIASGASATSTGTASTGSSQASSTSGGSQSSNMSGSSASSTASSSAGGSESSDDSDSSEASNTAVGDSSEAQSSSAADASSSAGAESGAMVNVGLSSSSIAGVMAGLALVLAL